MDGRIKKKNISTCSATLKLSRDKHAFALSLLAMTSSRGSSAGTTATNGRRPTRVDHQEIRQQENCQQCHVVGDLRDKPLRQKGKGKQHVLEKKTARLSCHPVEERPVCQSPGWSQEELALRVEERSPHDQGPKDWQRKKLMVSSTWHAKLNYV